MACSGFPDCKNTKKLSADGTEVGPKKIGMKCPTCNEGEIVERRVHRGRARGKLFWGCSRYPKCDYASWTNPLNPPKDGEAPVSDPTKPLPTEGRESEEDDAPEEEELNPEEKGDEVEKPPEA